MVFSAALRDSIGQLAKMSSTSAACAGAGTNMAPTDMAPTANATVAIEIVLRKVLFESLILNIDINY